MPNDISDHVERGFRTVEHQQQLGFVGVQSLQQTVESGEAGAATKMIWLALRRIEARWKNPPIFWHAAKAQLAIQFEDRFTVTE